MLILKRNKIKVLLLIGSIFLSSCSSVKPNLKISDDEMKSKIKSILILPVEMFENFFPAGYNFDDKTKIEIKKLYSSANDRFVKLSEEVFRDGRFHLKTRIDKNVHINTKNVKIVKVPLTRQSSLTKKETKLWENIGYELKKDFIIELAKKYNVDAIYFHYFQVVKKWSIQRWTSYNRIYSVINPVSAVAYYGKVYDKYGNILLNPHDTNYEATCCGTLYDFYNGNDDGWPFNYLEFINCKDDKAWIEKAPIDTVKGAYERWYIKGPHFDNYFKKYKNGVLRNFR